MTVSIANRFARLWANRFARFWTNWFARFWTNRLAWLWTYRFAWFWTYRFAWLWTNRFGVAFFITTVVVIPKSIVGAAGPTKGSGAQKNQRG
jgi:hypothetical protein